MNDLPTIRISPSSERSVKWMKIFGQLTGIPVRSDRPEKMVNGSAEITVFVLDNERLTHPQRTRLEEFYTNVIGFMPVDARDLVRNGVIPIHASDCEVEA